MINFLMTDNVLILAVNDNCFVFWQSLMRDILSKSKTGLVDDSNNGTGRTENEKKKLLDLVTDDICSAILETSFLRMLRKEKVHVEMSPTVGMLELWSSDFDSKIDFSNYRSRLVCPNNQIIVVS